MAKDFTNWHKFKAQLDSRKRPPTFSEGEIWWCSVGVNVGVEADGKNLYFERPILIIRKFNDEMLWALPLTSKMKKGRFYSTLEVNGVIETVMLSQIKTLSSKRLQRPIGKINRYALKKIKLAARIL
ncbi:MAG: type II toxin-antitoxin system PemK/MazF family toxin [Candidatus Gracilibacteria bacterium]|nr:type II toxin-antitoxin system PemK/MazF family toxin [Candidatus Gracilibacteria bacterium]